jgi:hypothetical protein
MRDGSEQAAELSSAVIERTEVMQTRLDTAAADRACLGHA